MIRVGRGVGCDDGVGVGGKVGAVESATEGEGVGTAVGLLVHSQPVQSQLWWYSSSWQVHSWCSYR